MRIVQVIEQSTGTVVYHAHASSIDLSTLTLSTPYTVLVYEQYMTDDFFEQYDSTERGAALNLLRSCLRSIPASAQLFRVRAVLDFARLTGHTITVEQAESLVDNWDKA